MTSQPDYIIIGGGTSGLVVANRLSEDPAVQVLILEAGDDLTADPRVNVPAFWTTLMGSEADWQFQSVPQAGLGGRSIKEPQGKTLGGSSAINGQAWIAPGRAGIDAWAKLGNPGWDWAGLLPFYKKAYTLRPPTDPETLEHLGIDWIDEEFRGTDGPIQVSFPGVKENPLCKAWIDAFRGLDKITSGDPFSGKSIGGYSNTAAVDPDAKVRSFAGSAYGLPALQRPNVKLVTKAQVQSIRFSKDADGSVIATEVQASVDGGEVTTFTPAKEVILAAGAYNTPKLLELSGIGSKTILDKHGIPVVLDLPGVGENLQDHLMTGVSYEVTEGVFTGDPLMRQEPEALAFAQKLYTEHKAGPFTVGGTQSHAFMPTPDANDSEFLKNSTSNEKDTELQEVIRSIVEKEDEASAAWFMFLAQANLHEGAKSFVGTQLMPENFASFGCSQTHPFSRGSTHIASTKPEDMPEIDPRYFSHPADLEIMARHVQAIDRLHNVKELAPFIKVDGKRNHPDAYKLQDLEGAKRYVLDTATTTYHSCGTAVMLPQEKGGVVDTELRVYGTKNLRIIDASIIPLVPRGNIMTSVYAVAEKAAHIIKGQ